MPRGKDQAAFVNRITSLLVLVGIDYFGSDECYHGVFVCIDLVNSYYKERSAKKSPGRGMFTIRGRRSTLSPSTGTGGKQ